MQSRSTSLAAINFAVLLFGASGLFAKLILLPAPVLVLGRVVFAAAGLFIVVLLLRRDLKVGSRADLAGFLGLGALLAVHWVSFFASIQLSTVAVGVLTFSTFPVFAVFIEALAAKSLPRPADIVISLLALAGVAVIVPAFDPASTDFLAVLWGLGSGASFALLSFSNRGYTARYSSRVVAFYQFFFAAVLLSPLLLVYPLPETAAQWALLVLLGLVFTAFAHTMFIYGLRHVTTWVAGILSTLEPVYAIALAWLVLGEAAEGRLLAGGALILAAACLALRRPGPAD